MVRSSSRDGKEGRQQILELVPWRGGVTVSNADRAGLETLDPCREPQSPGDTVHCQSSAV